MGGGKRNRERKRAKAEAVAQNTNMDPKVQLKLLDTALGFYVLHAMWSSIVMAAVDLVWKEKRDLFAVNPVNTLVYAGLVALTDRSIVHIGEASTIPCGVLLQALSCAGPTIYAIIGIFRATHSP